MSQHIDITDEATLVAALRLVRAQIAEKKELEAAIVDKLKGFLGDATEARIGGQTVAYYRWTKPRESIDVKEFRREYPDLAREFTKITPGSRRFVLVDPTTGEG